MIDLYYWPTPNGHKITLFLEEAKLPYNIIGVDIGKGDQMNYPPLNRNAVVVGVSRVTDVDLPRCRGRGFGLAATPVPGVCASMST
ncbi:MAG: hypothetical protein ACK5UX_10050, partial [Burkholderiales bacterium]